MTDSTPGWQPDPTGRHEHRYWDGSRWTDQVSDGGVATTDAYAGDAGDTPATEATAAPGDGGWDDPTTVQPNPGGDVTTSWDAVPPPPGAPTPPTPAGGPIGDDDGSKRKLLIGVGILAAVVLAVVLFLALGGDDDDDSGDVEARMAASLVEGGQLDEEQARCVSEHIVDELGAEPFEGFDFDSDSPPEGIDEAEFTGTLFGAMSECGLSPEDLGAPAGEEPAEGDEGDGDEGEGDDGLEGLPDDVEFDDAMVDQLADIYEQSLGLERGKAECLASTLAEAIESGALDEAQATSDFMEYLDECDISLSELGAAGG